MSTEQQATAAGTASTEATPASYLPEDQDTSAAAAAGESPQVATSTETPAAGAGDAEQQQEPANTTTSTPSSPKHGSNLLANFPNFLKKPFEKKHEETTEAGDQAVTETSDEAATAPPNQDKSEKRLSRTIMDILHKTKAKPENPPESTPAPAAASNEAEATTTGVLSEEHTEGEQTTDVPATGSTPSSPTTKEPIIDHLRKFFTKKPSAADTTNADSTTTPTPAAAPTTTQDDDAAAVEGDHPTVPTDQPATSEDSKPTSLSRRFSKMAQNLTTRIKETNRKQSKPTSGEGDATTEPTAKDESEEPTLDAAAASAAPPATNIHTADVEATSTPLPESVSNNGNGLPVPASA